MEALKEQTLEDIFASEFASHPIQPIDTPLDTQSVRKTTLELQDSLVKGIETGQFIAAETPVKHYFTEGAYAREMLIPAGTLIIGKIHKHAHLNFITKGKVAVVTEFGREVITAPTTMISQPGTKRVVYALEDTLWTTVHVTDETDLEKIEDHVIAKSYEELEQHQLTLKEQI